MRCRARRFTELILRLRSGRRSRIQIENDVFDFKQVKKQPGKAIRALEGQMSIYHQHKIVLKRRVDRVADRVSKSQEQIPFSSSIYSLRPASHGIHETFGPLSLVVYYIKWEVP